ncbi:RNase adapter RapZ [Dokdonella sp.]|uniref:RNase adapter RapZ n=1 Tax=Dokdonella sp. TaxID=2291710 RepID=UPI0031C6A1E6|nr:RNase adapter RapZ [Dokdonella sp.]
MVEPSETGVATPRADQLIIISGLSGSGKSVALRTLEDLGFYCVDNLPAALMPAFVHAISHSSGELQHRLAVGVDVRNRSENLNRLPQILSELGQSNVDYHLLFLDTRDEVLLKRYSETRRRHPLSADGLGLADAIAEERQLLRPMLAIADRVIDTSDLNVHQLRRLVISAMGLAGNSLTLLFESFAYRRGVPADADFIFDARCLPNPHWETSLRPLSGRDAPVREWLEARPEVARFYNDVCGFMETWLPAFQHDGRSYVTLCIGCTGGRHRSVYLADRLSAHFRGQYPQVLTHHRELEG